MLQWIETKHCDIWILLKVPLGVKQTTFLHELALILVYQPEHTSPQRPYLA